MKRKREHEEVPQLAIDAPPSNGQLAIDYNYDHGSTTVYFEFQLRQNKILWYIFSKDERRLVMVMQQHLHDDQAKHLFQLIIIHC